MTQSDIEHFDWLKNNFLPAVNALEDGLDMRTAMVRLNSIPDGSKSVNEYVLRHMMLFGCLEYDGDWQRPYNIRRISDNVTSLKAKLSTMTLALDATNKKNLTLEECVKASLAKVKEANELAAQAKRDAMNATTTLEVKVTRLGSKKTETHTGVFHRQFEQVCDLANARENIFIYGPTGCGKSHLCEQLAKVLGLEFCFVSCTNGMSEAVLGGRLLPVGKGGTFDYVISEFIRCYENGGVFLLDEMDAADPNVMLFINAALASQRVNVPNRQSKPYAIRHENFICVAAVNTFGTGADRLHSSRNKLDAATLDRFAMGKVIMDYDPNVEAKLCPDDPLRDRLLRYRKAVREYRMERWVSTRFLMSAYKMTHPEEFGCAFKPWSDERVDQSLFMGWREDEIHKVSKF